jgi:hypothetical protein
MKIGNFHSILNKMEIDNTLELLQLIKIQFTDVSRRAKRLALLNKIVGFIAMLGAIIMIKTATDPNFRGSSNDVTAISFLATRAIETIFEMEKRATCYSQVVLRTNYALQEINNWIQSVNMQTANRFSTTQLPPHRRRIRRASLGDGTSFYRRDIATPTIGTVDYSTVVDYVKRFYSELHVIELSWYTLGSYVAIKKGAVLCSRRVELERGESMRFGLNNELGRTNFPLMAMRTPLPSNRHARTPGSFTPSYVSGDQGKDGSQQHWRLASFEYGSPPSQRPPMSPSMDFSSLSPPETSPALGEWGQGRDSARVVTSLSDLSGDTSSTDTGNEEKQDPKPVIKMGLA